MKTPDVKLFLAPMEGVTDFVMRDLLTQIGGIDQCVTEFLRVTDRLHPLSVFYKNCPELKMGSRTRAGTPVFLQLLGGQAQPLAENAQRAAEIGALGIDLNFGCPAKTVNRHDGGATLLKSSDRLFNIVSQVRKSVPVNTPVTAKIRLGFDSPDHCVENALAIEEAGASWLTVHCRTKTDGYRPPAYWEWIPRIKEKTKLRIIANGEIWSVGDFDRCRQVTGAHDFMIGRAALRSPHIFQEIKIALKFHAGAAAETDLALLVPAFFEGCTSFINEHYATSRTKQWLSQLRLANGASGQKARDIFEQVKILKKPVEFKHKLDELLC